MQSPDPSSATPPLSLPSARLETRRAAWLPWLVPLLALLFVGLYWWRSREQSGPSIAIEAQEGHGLKAGAALRYRGISVGVVRAVELLPSLEGVKISVELDQRAAAMARAGSRFWIVRPHLALDEVSGLETVVGARYLAGLPGPADAPVQRQFVALEEPPLAAEFSAGGLEFQLAGEKRFGISPGAPIAYRGIRVGSILSVNLASDASQVDLRAYVLPEYAALVRSNSRFWETSGLELGMGWTGGFQLELESLRSLLVGGVAFATPTEAGELVSTGQRFQLESKPEEEWLQWRPRLPVGQLLLPAAASPPAMLRVKRRFKGGLLRLGRERSVSAWCLLLDDGLVGPTELLCNPTSAEQEDPVVVELLGAEHKLGAPLSQAPDLARVAIPGLAQPAFPRSRVRARVAGEALLVFGDAGLGALPMDGKYCAEDGRIEPTLSFESSFDGAAVLARSDGALVGLLRTASGGAHIAAIP